MSWIELVEILIIGCESSFLCPDQMHSFRVSQSLDSYFNIDSCLFFWICEAELISDCCFVSRFFSIERPCSFALESSWFAFATRFLAVIFPILLSFGFVFPLSFTHFQYFENCKELRSHQESCVGTNQSDFQITRLKTIVPFYDLFSEHCWALSWMGSEKLKSNC